MHELDFLNENKNLLESLKMFHFQKIPLVVVPGRAQIRKYSQVGFKLLIKNAQKFYKTV